MEVAIEPGGRGRKSIEHTAIGAGAGALLGGIFGVGKGAVIGGVSGLVYYCIPRTPGNVDSRRGR